MYKSVYHGLRYAADLPCSTGCFCCANFYHGQWSKSKRARRPLVKIMFWTTQISKNHSDIPGRAANTPNAARSARFYGLNTVVCIKLCREFRCTVVVKHRPQYRCGSTKHRVCAAQCWENTHILSWKIHNQLKIFSKTSQNRTQTGAIWAPQQQHRV